MKRVEHFVPLVVLKGIAAGEVVVEYLTGVQVLEIQKMALLRRGRLSVQPVTEEAYDVIVMISERGGWAKESKGGRPAAGSKRVRSEGEGEGEGMGEEVSVRKRTRRRRAA